MERRRKNDFEPIGCQMPASSRFFGAQDVQCFRSVQVRMRNWLR